MVRKKKNHSELTEESRLKFTKVAKNLQVVSTQDWLKTNFIPYAWSYTLDRALVDVSGLKPVQRRILYTMFKRGLSPTSNRVKVATLGGAVLQFHPHGDASVVQALKNIERKHIFRVPLIDGKGDFGSIGMPGAAGRYIEARLSKAAWLNVEDISQNAVEMIPNYDNTTVEPKRIPVKWPVGVINGGSGMAIAYASKIPSHNPGEIMKACIELVKNPNATHRKLESIIKGPDFAMGGVIVSNDGIKDYLETGSGTFTLRSKYELIPMKRGAYRIEYYEIPFGTNPEKIIEDIQKQMDKGNLKEISNYKNLSDLKHPVRMIVEVKAGSQIKKVIEDLFRMTSLQIRFSVNMTTIVNNRPEQLPMRDILLDFIEFRKLCIVNKTKYILSKKQDRLHLIDGLMKVLLDIDATIKIIRGADNVDIAREKLAKKFHIDDDQANYVLSLQLRRLTKMDKLELNNEHDQLIDEVTSMTDLISDGTKLNDYLIKEFKETLKVIDDERCTEISDLSDEEFNNQKTTEVKQMKAAGKGVKTYVYQLADGSIFKTPVKLSTAKDLEQSNPSLKATPITSMMTMPGNADMAVLDSSGQAYTTSLLSIEDNKSIDLKKSGLHPNKHTKPLLTIGDGESTILLVTKTGRTRHIKVDNVGKWSSTDVVKLDDGDDIVGAVDTSSAVKGSTVIMVSKRGKVLRFPLDTLKPCNAGCQTVAGMRLGKGDEVASVTIARPDAEVIVTTSSVTAKATPAKDIPVQSRGGGGSKLHPILATDSIDQLAVDPVFVYHGKIVPAPAPSARASRPAPMRKGTLLSM
jgi:DNA gyrase subunit A